MCPVLFSIGEKYHVYGYGLMMVIGIISCFFFAYKRAKTYGIDQDVMMNGSMYGTILGLVGAKLMYWIVSFKDIVADLKEDPKNLIGYLTGGFVVYGGLILGILVAVWYFKLHKKGTVMDKLDLAVPSISLAQGFGRLGCFMAGCCYGRPVPAGAWYGITFPYGGSAPAGVSLYPTQLMSSAADFLLCLLLWYLTTKEKFRGEIVSLFLILYSVGRFIIELFRGDIERGYVGSLSTSQFIAIFIFAAGVALFLVMRKLNLSPLKIGGYPEKEEKTPAVEKEA